MIYYAAPILSRVFTPDDPVVEPVTVQEVKDWAMIDGTDFDLRIPNWITAARRNVERWCGVSLISGTVLFKTRLSKDGEVIQSPLPFALSMENVSDVVVNTAADGVDPELQVLDEDYYLDSSIRFVSNGTYNIAYTITYTAIPEDLKQAILMLVAYRYRNAGDQPLQLGIPEDVESVIQTYRVPCL